MVMGHERRYKEHGAYICGACDDWHYGDEICPRKQDNLAWLCVAAIVCLAAALLIALW